MVVYWQHGGILSMRTVFLTHVCVCTSGKKHRERLKMMKSEYMRCLPGADIISYKLEHCRRL